VTRDEEAAFLAAHPPVRNVVRRSWRERLFSLPWRPWVVTSVEWNDPYPTLRLAHIWRGAHARLMEGLAEKSDEYLSLLRSPRTD
jgi:hypothetical protein